MYGDTGYVFHKGSHVAKMVEAWIQQEIRRSRCHGCAVARKENNVHNIYILEARRRVD